jgi:hypothetical protein
MNDKSTRVAPGPGVPVQKFHLLRQTVLIYTKAN